MLESIYDVANFDELTDELIELFKEFDKELNAYDTDVYLYYDEDTNTAELDTFVNPGGNSWIQDDHYTIYTDKQHYGDYMDWYEGNLDLIADALGITIEDLCLETMEYNNTDDEDDISEADVLHYIYNCGKYGQILYDYYCDVVDTDYESEYADKAREVWDKFDADLEYWRDEYKYHR
jgi:hypothetical protein